MKQPKGFATDIYLFAGRGIDISSLSLSLPTFVTKLGGDSSPTFFKLQPISTTGLLDNRLGRVVGGIKISGDVIIT